MKRGRKAIPTALKIVRGNPGKRPLNDREPQPPTDSPPYMPDHLDEMAQKEWKRIVPILEQMRVLTEADYMTLATLCQAFSTMAEAQRQLTRAGILYKTNSGYIQQSPLIAIVNQNALLVAKLCREFGLTPSARATVKTNEDKAIKADDPWDKILR